MSGNTPGQYYIKHEDLVFLRMQPKINSETQSLQHAETESTVKYLI